MAHKRPCPVPGCQNKYHSFKTTTDLALKSAESEKDYPGYGLSFFTFPQDRKRNDEWCTRLKIEIPFERRKRMRICEAHFADSMFRSSKKHSLKPDALPSYNNHVVDMDGCIDNTGSSSKNSKPIKQLSLYELTKLVEKQKEQRRRSDLSLRDYRQKLSRALKKIDTLEDKIKYMELTPEKIDKAFPRDRIIAALVKERLLHHPKKKKPKLDLPPVSPIPLPQLPPNWLPPDQEEIIKIDKIESLGNASDCNTKKIDSQTVNKLSVIKTSEIKTSESTSDVNIIEIDMQCSSST